MEESQMSKRLTFKSALSFIVILFTAFFLVGCGDTDQELVDAALSDVALVFATGDSATSVTQNLSLPTAVGETITISWSSDKTAVISNAGVVVRPAVGQPDATVVLTGTLTMGEATATKAFTLVVKAMVLTDQQTVDAAVPNVAITYATGDSATLVNEDVVLPTAVGTVVVAWSSDTPAVISNAGVVVRPAKGEADATVVLTATLTKGTATATKTFTLVVHALQYTDQELVDMAVTALMVGYAVGDTVDTVTADVTLAATSNTATVAWASDTPAVISNAGVVVRPAKGEADVVVILTATLTIGAVEETKTFTLTVLAIPYTEEDATAALDISGTDLVYNAETSRYTTTSDITLPETSLEFDIVWTSGNETFIGANGVVVRPAYGETDSTVILTATIGEETKEFIVTVLAITVKPAALKLADAATILLLSGGIEAGVVTGKLELATTVGTEGVTVAWASSDTTVITSTGSVYRPELGEENANVTLTATLSVDDESTTKVFNVIVTARTVAAEFSGTIAEVMAQAKDTYVRVVGVTIFGEALDGFYIADATGTAFIYGAAIPTDFDFGSVVDIEGFIDIYYLAMQISGTDAEPIYVLPSDAAVTEVAYPETAIDSITSMALPAVGTEFNMMPVTVTARVLVTGTGNYDVFLVPVDHRGDLDKDTALMIYYKSNIAALRPLDGQKVQIEIVVSTYRTNDLVWTFVFLQEAEDITIIPNTDLEWIEIAQGSLAYEFEKEYVLTETFELPTDIEGVAISWVSDNELFDVTTGVLAMPLTGQEDVTLTATLTKGDATGEFTATFKAGDKPVQTIAEALAVSTGDLVHVVGVVTANQYYRIFFIQDDTGGIAIYTSDADLITFLTTNYGKEVDIVGTRAANYGLNEISYTQIYSLVGDATMPIAVNIDSFELDATALAPYQGQLVELTGLAVLEIDEDKYGNISVTLYDANANEEIILKWDSRFTLTTEAAAVLDSIAVNDVIDIVNPLAWDGGPRLFFTDSTTITKQDLSDAERVALAKSTAVGYFEDEYNVITTLVPFTSLFGATIAYDTASEYFDVTTGEVTLPTMGRETVSITATISFGTETDTATIEFIVGPYLISDVKAGVDDDEFRIQGIVISSPYNATYFIQDESGALAIYTYDTALQALLVLGDLVEITGVRDSFGGLIEFAPSTVVVLDNDVTLPDAVNVDSLDLDDEALLPYQSQVVVMTQMVVNSIATGYNNYSVILYNAIADDTIELRYDTRLTISTTALDVLHGLVVGDIVDVTSVLSWYFTGPQYIYTESTIVVDTPVPSAEALAAVDKMKADADAAELTIVAKVEEATTLDLDVLGTNGSTIVWTSTDDLVIDPDTGIVVLPAEGQVTITLTATVTLNLAETVVTFDVLVGVPSAPVVQTLDLYFSEYIEGSSYNKAIEIYNPTNATIDLTTYTVELYSNGSATVGFTETLTGTLNAGQTLVLVYASATAAFKVGNYVESAVTNFNGDDTILLKNDGAIIDSFGQNGFDPGTSWTVGGVSTANMTLIRKAAVKYGDLDSTNVFDPSAEWVAFEQDTTTYLGYHAPDLFISEYIEGSSSNKALEIYNPTVETIDLSTYVIEQYKGTLVADYTLSLTGTLAPGAVYVIAADQASTTVLDLADLELSYPSIVHFTGDDTIVLKNATTIIDCIGQIGFDPGTAWGVSTVSYTAEMTLVRNVDIMRGYTDALAVYDPTLEWTFYPQDTFTYLGSHTVS